MLPKSTELFLPSFRTKRGCFTMACLFFSFKRPERLLCEVFSEGYRVGEERTSPRPATCLKTLISRRQSTLPASTPDSLSLVSLIGRALPRQCAVVSHVCGAETARRMFCGPHAPSSVLSHLIVPTDFHLRGVFKDGVPLGDTTSLD